MNELQTAYVYGLAHLLPLGETSARKTYRLALTRDSWRANPQELRRKLEESIGPKSEVLLTTNWDALVEEATIEIRKQEQDGIRLLSIDDSEYPPLLKKIADAPLILFVKGSVSAFLECLSVAIIGTRDSTPAGEQVAFKVARFFGANRCAIVSGLAKGIDTAAHKGALDAGAKTVAVFATPLDKVYPAENKELARQILDDGGAWVSEIPLRKKTHRNSFVQRDRIQSGLSVAVIPVQTGIEGGTMHTVDFAERQSRLLFCPRPLNVESGAKQYQGINQLIHSGRAESFQADTYSAVLKRICEHRENLIAGSFAAKTAIQKVSDQTSLGFRESPGANRKIDTELIDVLTDKLSTAGVDDESRFEGVIRAVRDKLFALQHRK